MFGRGGMFCDVDMVDRYLWVMWMLCRLDRDFELVRPAVHHRAGQETSTSCTYVQYTVHTLLLLYLYSTYCTGLIYPKYTLTH